MDDREERNPKGNTVLLTVIAVATLLVAVIGATFAYFSVTITGNDTASSVIVKTGTLGITFNDGSFINATNIQPDDVIPSKTFTVANTGTYAITYTVEWTNVVNTFGITDSNNPTGRTDMEYGIAGTVTTGTGTAGSVSAGTTVKGVASGDIAGLTEITILPGAVHTYVLTFVFEDTDLPQDYDQGRTFSAQLQIYIPEPEEP